MNFKIIASVLLAGILIGGGIAYKIFVKPPQIIKDTKVVENTKYIDRIIKGKDGTVITERIYETKKETIEKTKPLIPKVRLGLLGSYDFSRKETNYGLTITKPLTQNLEVGVYVMPNAKEVGISASWGF